MSSVADVTGYIFILGSGAAIGGLCYPLVKDWLESCGNGSEANQLQAKEWLKQFKPEQIAVIKNYLEHGGYSAGVAAVTGDLNFLMLSQQIGKTLRECPELLDKAMFAPPGQES